MAKLFRKYIYLFLAVTSLVIFGSNSASAINQKSSGGITVSPASQQIVLNSGEDERPLQLTITNHLTRPQTIYLSAQDFNALDESGGLFFLGTSGISLSNKYRLADWISLPADPLTIPPGQSTIVNAKIINETTLAPGGHYGAILLSILAPASSSTVSTHAIASSLLFVNKVGGDIHKLSLTSLSARHSIFSLPATLNLTFRNGGNTHVIPRGVANITTANGRLISQSIINQDSKIILPSNSRHFESNFNSLAKITRPGRYTLSFYYRYDGYGKYKLYKSSILIILPTSWFPHVAFSGIVFGGFYYFFIMHKNAKRYRRTVWIETKLVIRDLKLFIKFIYRKIRKLLAKT